MSACIRKLSAAMWLAGAACGAMISTSAAQSKKPLPRPAPVAEKPSPVAPGTQRPAAGRSEVRPAAGERPINEQSGSARPGSGKPPAAAQTAPNAPFVLTPEEEAELDKVLLAWQAKTKTITKFRCKFKLYEYGGLQKEGADPNKPQEREGELYYSCPDKGSYEILKPKEGEHWICDGRAVYEFNYAAKTIVEHRLPEEMQGKAISQGPLPFLFGADAEEQKRRYFLRLDPQKPASKGESEIWIEAYPRYQADAANFRQAKIILHAQTKLPKALRILDMDGKSSRSYALYDLGLNELLMGKLWKSPFEPKLPGKDWKKEIKYPDTPEAGPAPMPTARKPAAPTATQPKRK